MRRGNKAKLFVGLEKAGLLQQNKGSVSNLAPAPELKISLVEVSFRPGGETKEKASYRFFEMRLLSTLSLILSHFD